MHSLLTLWRVLGWRDGAITEFIRTREVRRSGRLSVRVGYCVLAIVVAMDCGGEVTRAYRGVNEDLAIGCGA